MGQIRDFVSRYWMPIFIGISLLYVSYYLYGQLDRVDRTVSFSVLPLLGSALIQVVYWVLMTYLWTVVLQLASGTKVRLSDGFFQLCLIILGKYIQGKIWGVPALPVPGLRHVDLIALTGFTLARQRKGKSCRRKKG